jgi:Fe2+ or Zn2+ uptake regulation protein
MDIENILKAHKKSVTKERKDVFKYINTKHIFSSNDVLTSFQSI